MTELIRGLYHLKPHQQGCVLTIGNFDGVHLGHQALLAQVKKKAIELGLSAAVMTFDPLPKEFFSPNNSMPRLTRWREQMSEFIHYCMDQVFLVRFDKKLASLSAKEFVEQILYQKLAVKHLIVGDDFHFGHDRQGDFAFLQELSQRYGYTVEKMGSFLVDGVRVSSTQIRTALEQSDLCLAMKLLGHPYSMQGRVVHGDKLGRVLGFPTANIYLHRLVTPVKGVYAVRLFGIDAGPLLGVASVGNRPTVNGTEDILEVYLFDFNRDIYGQHVKVEFLEKIRDQACFSTLELLQQQIQHDVEQARNYFVKKREG